MEQKNKFVVLCMLIGMCLGLAAGWVIGRTQEGSFGISMCYGLVAGMVIGICIGAWIQKIKDKE